MRRQGRGRGWRLALLLVASLGGRSTATPAPSCRPEYADRCKQLPASYGNYVFIVDDKELRIGKDADGCFSLQLSEGFNLDGPALPRFEKEERVWCATIISDKGAHRSDVNTSETLYAAALRSLNVSVSEQLNLYYGTLSKESFENLTNLRKLALIEMKPSAWNLSHLSNLRALLVESMNFTADNFELLPTDLEILILTETGIDMVPAAALAHCYKLTKLEVTDSKRVLVEAGGRLQKLTVKSDDKSSVSLALPSKLEYLKIGSWEPSEPLPWKACAKLGELVLSYATAEVLPARWVTNCTELHTLTVTHAKNLTRLEKDTLRGAKKLKRVMLSQCALEALPFGLLDDARDLVKLDLSENKLHTLPSGLFVPLQRLKELVLSKNELNNLVLDLLEVAEILPELSILRLDGNKALDVCPKERIGNYIMPQGKSKLGKLKNLTKLNLSHTNTSLVCEDWRQQLPQLQELRLSYTAITSLQHADLQFNTVNDVTVELTGAHVTTLMFDRTDWAQSVKAVHLVLSEPLRCDCDLYWAAKALKEKRLSVEGALCEDGRALGKVPPDELLCELPCPANCTCGMREDFAAGRVLRLACAGAGLRRVPSLSETLAALPGGGDDYALELRLANNRIDTLSPRDLPPNLETLDLRNNSLALIDAVTAVKLATSRRNLSMRLAGNPLECSCRALGALSTMHNVIADLAVATCDGGASLMEAVLNPRPECNNNNSFIPGIVPIHNIHTTDVTPETNDESYNKVAVAAALAAVAVAAAALALALLRPELRIRAKAALRAWGLLPRAREADDGRVYDAFVSFAHADEVVVRELVAQLESGPKPLRLCVHYRDWAPGGWIPTQIAASVRVSRRTVAVVSAAFLRSKWARAEFREAYAAALRDAEPRLVVVLLEDPSRLQLDAELRAYLAANTYVRWGDPWFWPKLRRALPAPRRTARRRRSTNTSAVSDVSLRSPLTESTDASSVRTAATASTDASVLTTATGSTDASIRSAVTASTDASVRSAATASTDVSVPMSCLPEWTNHSQSAATALPTVPSITISTPRPSVT